MDLRLPAVLSMLLMAASASYAAAADDAYIARYAAGALKHNLNLDMPSLVVRDGVIILPINGLDAGKRAKAVRLLSKIPGAKGVRLSETLNRHVQAARAERLLADRPVLSRESGIYRRGRAVPVLAGQQQGKQQNPDSALSAQPRMR